MIGTRRIIFQVNWITQQKVLIFYLRLASIINSPKCNGNHWGTSKQFPSGNLKSIFHAFSNALLSNIPVYSSFINKLTTKDRLEWEHILETWWVVKLCTRLYWKFHNSPEYSLCLSLFCPTLFTTHQLFPMVTKAAYFLSFESY